MTRFLEATVLVERLVTIIASAYNALFFAGYRQGGRRGHRLGAAVLALVNVAFLAEAFHGGLSLVAGQRSVAGAQASPLRLIAATLSLAACLAMGILVVRHQRRRRR